jgi:CHAD domain-containing protein
MNVDTQSAVKSLRKLYKLLKDFPAHPSPEDVHDLRTHARRLEAVVHTFSSHADRDAERLLRLIKPVRKSAGQVRDMDVFIARIHQIKIEPEGDSLVRLIEHVAKLRQKHLASLHQVIARGRKRTRRSIKQYVGWLRSRIGEVSPAAPQILAAELDHWPRLHAGNLHEFRIHAKELRYMLQLFPETEQVRMDALADVKDSAGEWHDWVELHAIARDILDPAADRHILHQIREISRDRLRVGLSAADRLRKGSLNIPKAA